jgi:hypothetical protein
MRVIVRAGASLVIGAVVTFFVACSTGGSGGDGGSTTAASFDCTTYGAHDCPNDPPTADTDVSDCQAAESDPLCGTEATAALACEQGAHTCAADGTTDSFTLQQTCAASYAAYTRCVTDDEADGSSAATVSGIVAAGYGDSDEGAQAGDVCTSVGDPGAGTEQSIDFGDPPCDECMAEICCAPVTTCAASTSCATLAACELACAPGDDTCATACTSADSSASVDSPLYAAIIACRSASCITDAGIGLCN